LALALAAPGTASGKVGGNHVFDAELSLTGGCAVSTSDPIPDPGLCPMPPGVAGVDHPTAPFLINPGSAVDSEGYVYMSNIGVDTKVSEISSNEFLNGRIDVFRPNGEFVTEIADGSQPESMTVDGEGNLYVVNHRSASAEEGVVRYTPNAYPPEPSTAYTPTVVLPGVGSGTVAVNRQTAHLLVGSSSEIEEFGSAAEGNPLLRTEIGKGQIESSFSLAVDADTGDIFVSSLCEGCSPAPDSEHPFVSVVYVFSEDGSRIGEISGAELPAGGFKSGSGRLFVAVDEATDELFVSDVAEGSKVYRFTSKEGGGFQYKPDPELESHSYTRFGELAVANGPGSPNQGDVYIPSPVTQPGHLYVFTPELESGPPIVGPASISNLTSSEAGFHTEINPNGFSSEYSFQYVEEATYLEDLEDFGPGHGFDHASQTSPGALPVGHLPKAVFAGVEGLSPGTAYRVRALASDHCQPSEAGKVCTEAGEEAHFITYPASLAQGSCPNEALRTGLSATLPDCRAYELVSPPETNGRQVEGARTGQQFETQLVSSDGQSAIFATVGGTVPAINGNGALDGYRAQRTANGWRTEGAGPSGAQSQSPESVGASPGGSWLWSTGPALDHGNLVIGGEKTSYLRRPDGGFALLGQGPLASDPRAQGLWISADGAHALFSSGVRLTEDASPKGVATIYERTADGATRVVSLLPAGGAPGAGADVQYEGASEDGAAIAFAVTEGGVATLYERLGGERTLTVAEFAERDVAFGGVSPAGRLTYVKGGDIFSFDPTTETSTKVGSGGKSTVVNVSADGSHVYFVSTVKLLSEFGPVASKENLYVWDAETQSIFFIAILEPSDLEREELVAQTKATGLGKWVGSVGHDSAADTSRTTPDGTVILFESNAELTAYDSGGHTEIYRYQVGSGGGLSCLSCNPTGAAANSGNSFQTFLFTKDEFAPTYLTTPVANLTADGRRAFFQSSEALVPTDQDGTQDVYEWEAEGLGGCTRAAGCLSLVSSGRSSVNSYLYGVTPSGDDVFFTTADQLNAEDLEATRSIYDARVDGGFPPPQVPAAECLGEACQPAAVVPEQVTPTSAAFHGSGNAATKAKKRGCPKGTHPAPHGGKGRCTKHRHIAHHKHQRRRRPTNGKGAQR
jgi:hypothetical protein